MGVQGWDEWDGVQRAAGDSGSASWLCAATPSPLQAACLCSHPPPSLPLPWPLPACSNLGLLGLGRGDDLEDTGAGGLSDPLAHPAADAMDLDHLRPAP